MTSEDDNEIIVEASTSLLNENFQPQDQDSHETIPLSLKRYDVLMKVLLVGDTSIGKTTLLHAFIDDHFEPNIQPTIVIDFQTKILNVSEKNVKLQIWDTSGQARFNGIRENFFLGAKGAIFCFDSKKKETFQNLPRWIKEVEERSKNDSLIKAIVALRCDESCDRAVSKAEAHHFAIEHQARYCEVSVQTMTNVSEPFQAVASSILALEEGWQPPALRTRNSVLNPVGRASVVLRSISHRVSWKRRPKSLSRSFRFKSFRRRKDKSEAEPSDDIKKANREEKDEDAQKTGCVKIKMPKMLKSCSLS